MSEKHTSPKSILKRCKRVMWIIISTYIIYCALLYFLQDSIIFPRHVIPDVSNFKSPEVFEQVWIKIDNTVQVEGWYLPSQVTATPQPAVIFFHGNGEIIDFLLDDIQQYQAWGFSILLPEYRGYGRSTGIPGQAAISADMKKFRDWLLQRPEVDNQRIIYHGRSLGGGIACELTLHHPPAALILQSTFLSLAKMTRKYLVPPFLLTHHFRNDKVLAQLNIPIFITHGSQDTIIPVWHSQQLHRIAENSLYYEVSSGHNDYPMDRKFWQRIENFLRKNQLLRN